MIRRFLTGLAVVTLVAGALGVIASPVAAKRPKQPKLVFSGAVNGKAKGIHQFCVESTGIDGLQLGVSLTSFTVGEDKYSLSVSFRGAVYAAGEHPFSAPKQGATGAIVTFAADDGPNSWTSGDGNGTATLNSDEESGKFAGDLLAGSGVGLKDGPGVYVKGRFKCTQVDKA